MRTVPLVVLILLALLAVGFFVVHTVPTHEGDITVEIADTPETRERGLSGRAAVPSDYGMLFVFPNKDLHGFWMKDMLVSIDILWLSDDGTIIGMQESVSPETYPDAFYPPEPVRYVLETRVGEAARQGWSIGSRVPIPK